MLAFGTSLRCRGQLSSRVEPSNDVNPSRAPPSFNKEKLSGSRAILESMPAS